jgi:hypothetical protein
VNPSHSDVIPVTLDSESAQAGPGRRPRWLAHDRIVAGPSDPGIFPWNSGHFHDRLAEVLQRVYRCRTRQPNVRER